MVESIDYPIAHLLIIDNGGKLGALETPAVVRQTTILNMPANLGVAGSWNLGIKSFPLANHWFFASNDMFFMSGSLHRLYTARSDGLVLSDMFPHWHTFSLGYRSVAECGLFDEGFFPAYFEDNDMARRLEHAGLPIYKINIPTHHKNSSTINSDENLKFRNATTFSNNQRYFRHKIATDDYGEGGWSIERRRLNSWE